MLGDESLRLLREVTLNKNVKTKDLQTSFGFSRRQVDYRFKKINEWLVDNNFPEVERTKRGEFIIHPIVQSLVTDQKEVTTQTQVPNEKERIHLLILMLLSMKEEYSLNHFSIELKVSKNTILADLKVVQEMVSSYELFIQYSRKHGYYLSGTEFNVRRLLIQTVRDVITMIDGEKWFFHLTGIDSSEVKGFYQKVEHIENELDLKFTDEKVQIMPYILSLIFNRIQKGALIKDLSINYEEFSDTKEYKASGELFSHTANVPVEERIFITLKLLSTNMAASTLIEEVIPELSEAIEEMLVRFEKLALIELQDKSELLNSILLHVKPAYYRIKYKLTNQPTLQATGGPEFQNLHHLVKRASQPLRDFFGMDISEEESKYLTMLIGGWLRRQGDSIQHKLKAIVVCPNGVSVSKHLHSTLSNLFPEFVFMDSLSIREFKSYDYEFQVVFSPTFLDTDQNLFIVEPFLTGAQKRQLRKKVFEQLNGYFPSLIDWDEVVSLIGQHATIHDREELIRALTNYVYKENGKDLKGDAPIFEEEAGPAITHLLKPETISIRDQIESYGEAIRVAADPLLQNGVITSGYIDKMVRIHDTDDPYAILGEYIAIPHASMEDGVKNLSMSMLKMTEGIPISAGINIYLIVVIAPDGNGHHLRALQQLEEISSSEEAITELCKAKTKKELWEYLKVHTQ
ncbi:PTS sugar transporter subunit IIA [Lentibacillus kapialis]|uniref:Ascorbate-specific PTS system EIIA component n=1 Tax=Lentibacillus kapialis TaxID=340214 RepID=A0A917UZG6_9BACI|nr:BglG family transcription antiterminator [Lentibacillus kapialis]GGK00622.1 PTS sugar transporter subunit IIA [Lentibacillus kapialis]